MEGGRGRSARDVDGRGRLHFPMAVDAAPNAIAALKKERESDEGEPEGIAGVARVNGRSTRS